MVSPSKEVQGPGVGQWGREPITSDPFVGHECALCCSREAPAEQVSEMLGKCFLDEARGYLVTYYLTARTIAALYLHVLNAL